MVTPRVSRATGPSIIRIVIALILVLLFTLLIVENAQTVRLHVFFFHVDIQLAVALVLAGVLGVVVGLLVPRMQRVL